MSTTMTSIFDFIYYILIFLSVYVQVFFFVTFLENRKKIVIRQGKIKLENYPAVTITVPCWNEEDTVEKTVNSLLSLNYPKDKLKIFLIDDGSTDNTLNILNKFKDFSNIKVFHKENGGKHTAVNLGLENSDTDFFGCLDADSSADPESLTRMISYFEKDPNVMAIVPSLVVNTPKNFIQHAQEQEYHMGIFFRKMLSFLGAIQVTPGPLTIFRKKVFDDLGPYRQAHDTEDLEIAYRMQKNNYKIEHCNDAFVYTNTPPTIKKLYRQRVRWIYGFINNTIDYRKVIFNKKYGNFSLFTVPAGIISIISICYLFGRTIYNLGNLVYSKVIQLKTVGFNFTFKGFNLDPFFINTQFIAFLVFITFIFVILSITLGKRMAKGKWIFSFKILYFFLVFSIISPIWFIKAFLNTILSRKPAWR